MKREGCLEFLRSNGNIYQKVSIIHKIVNGMKLNLDRTTKKNFFESSFKASIRGWRIPRRLALFGPNRNCPSPNSFRSRSVKKATASILKTIITIIITVSVRLISFFIIAVEKKKKNKPLNAANSDFKTEEKNASYKNKGSEITGRKN